MLSNPKHESARREVLAALDAELAKLRQVITSTDALIAGLDERARQLNELHRIRHARLDLMADESEKPYRLQTPSATWGIP